MSQKWQRDSETFLSLYLRLLIFDLFDVLIDLLGAVADFVVLGLADL